MNMYLFSLKKGIFLRPKDAIVSKQIIKTDIYKYWTLMDPHT